MTARLFALALLAALAGSCASGVQPAKVETRSYGLVVDDQALNGSPNTGYIETRGDWAGLRLDIQATRVAYTDISFVCVHSDDQSTDYQIVETAAGGAVTQWNPTYTTSSGVNFSMIVNVAGFDYLKCTFSGTAAGASDKITVEAYLTRGY